MSTLGVQCLHEDEVDQGESVGQPARGHYDRRRYYLSHLGLNDIPCLQEAGIGISINAKSELNINAADVIILNENLHKILALIRFLKRGNIFINLNLFWVFAYNIVIMPIVAGVFYHWDLSVSPVWSSIAMSCSSLFVVGFSHIL
ncbi:unnamed protein product [Sphagnum balticum]